MPVGNCGAERAVKVRARVYPTILTHTQATGRWSIVDYPTQQLTQDLSGVLRPDKGKVWLGHDWDQVELWLQGAIAKDEPLLRAKREKWDIHALNTCEAFQLPYPPTRVDAHGHPDNAGWRDLVGWRGKDDPRRSFSKRFVYRILYRGNPAHAGDIPGAKALGLSSANLAAASRHWLDAHPAIPLDWARTDEFILRHGYTETFAGRKRRTLSVGPGGKITEAICRELCNHRMQGSVADLLNLSLIEMTETMPFLKLLGSKHDALTMECPEELEEEAWPEYQRIVQQDRDVMGTRITFPASFKVTRWDGTEKKVEVLT